MVSPAAPTWVLPPPSRDPLQGRHASRDRVDRRQPLLPEESSTHEARLRRKHQELVDFRLDSEFLSQTGASVDFNYDVESAYLKCSFFEEDVETMVNLLLDLALREKKLFHVRHNICRKISKLKVI